MSIFEVCVDNMESVLNAFNGGADRLELCSALSEGGLTPSLGFLRAARKATSIDFPIFTMIRPRGGNFVYTNEEIDIMVEDIKNLKAGGADGFVFGLLTKENKIDIGNCKRLLEIAKPLPVTFHRAFDEIKSQEDMLKAADDIMDLGITRLLTSGGSDTAENGVHRIMWVANRCEDRLIIVPGSGVSPNNLEAILLETKLNEFHGSAKGPVTEDGLIVTNEETVRRMKYISICVENSRNK